MLDKVYVGALTGAVGGAAGNALKATTLTPFAQTVANNTIKAFAGVLAIFTSFEGRPLALGYVGPFLDSLTGAVGSSTGPADTSLMERNTLP